MSLVSINNIAAAEAEFGNVRHWLDGYRKDMHNHPIAGWCLQNYVVLTLSPEFLRKAGESESDIYWTRYYWLARFNRVWSTLVGRDAGMEQQLLNLLETAPDGLESLPKVEKAAERDALDQLREAGIV